jgi:hypothetical protein
LSYDPFFFFLLCFFRLPFFHHFLGLCGGRKCKRQHPSWQVETELHTRRLHLGHVSRIRRVFVGRIPWALSHCSLCPIGSDSVFMARSDPGQILYLFMSIPPQLRQESNLYVLVQSQMRYPYATQLCCAEPIAEEGLEPPTFRS